jgi:hypothetical protein
MSLNDPDPGKRFDSIVAENQRRGLYLSQLESMIAVARDPRCTRRHIRVHAEIVSRINSKSGMAYPGRATIARDTAMLLGGIPDPAGGYSDGVIRNVTSDLLRWGHMASAQRGPEGGGRAIAHYTVAQPSVEKLQQEITAWVEKARARDRLDTMLEGQAGVTNADDTRMGAGVTSVRDTSNSGVTCVGGAGVTCVGGTVTSKRELEERVPPTPPKGVNGHGVLLDGQAVTLEAAFETFWVAFPDGRKRGKGGTADLFAQIAAGKHRKRRATAQELVDGARRYAASHPDPKYVPMPETWLNGGRWADDIAQPDIKANQAKREFDEQIARLRAEEDAKWHR